MFYSAENGLNYTVTQKLLASDRVIGDRFGVSVSVYNSTIVVGAHLQDEHGTSSGIIIPCPNAFFSLTKMFACLGAAYVFLQYTTGWSESQKLVASVVSQAQYFGEALQMHRDYLLVGAKGSTLGWSKGLF